MAKKVIFVDDSRTILATVELATEELVKSGSIEFETYINPMEFLEKVKSGQESYDLLFTDLNMPQMSGLDLAKELKSIPNLKMKPILALTTESSPEIKAQGKTIGLTGWITKPFSDAKILGAIKKLLAI